MAGTTVNEHPPQAIFALSDATIKGIAVATEGVMYLVGTPFNDQIYGVFGDSAIGLNGGYDVLMAVDPAADIPGRHKVATLQGGGENNGSMPGDLYLLGDARKVYYAGKVNPNSLQDDDYAFIDGFDPQHSIIRLRGSAEDYRLVQVPIVGLGTPGIGTAIVLKSTCDVIGYVRNVSLTNLNSHNFEFASVPNPTPAIPSGKSGLVQAMDQLGNGGATSWPGALVATDHEGNVYLTFASSSPLLESESTIPRTGSYYLAKYDATGRRLWLHDLGTAAGSGDSRGPQIPTNIVTYQSFVYVTGINFGPYGGAKPSRSVLGFDGFDGFIAKISAADGSELAARNFLPSSTSLGATLWTTIVGPDGDLYIGGTDLAGGGLPPPLGTPYVMKIDGNDLRTLWKTGFQNGPPVAVTGNIQDLLNLGTLQLTNFPTGLAYVPDGQGPINAGHLYVSGVSDNGQFYGANPGWNNIWYAKLDSSDGALTWSDGGKSISAPGADSFEWGSTADSAGNVYIAGITGGRFGNQYAPGVGLDDAFVTKLDPAGNVVWTTYIGTTASDRIRGITISNDVAYVVGDTRGSLANAGAGLFDVWVGALNPEGQILGLVQFGSERDDYGIGIAASKDSVFVSGITEGSMCKTSASIDDAFLARIPKTAF